MARRRPAEDPKSQLALWARRLALFAFAVALLAIIALRLDLLEVLPGLVTFGGAVVIAGIAVILAFAAFVAIWREGVKGFGAAFLSLMIGAGLIVYPAYLVARSYRLPALSDIATDPADPPRFEVIARLRPREANPVAYPGAAAAQLQSLHYPDIEPLELTVPPQEAYQATRDAIAKRKWRVVDERAPQAGRREGHIEAVARTALMGFRDDVVVRIRALRTGTRIDVRSASRYGRRDFGANAERIRALLEDIDGTVGSQAAASR